MKRSILWICGVALVGCGDPNSTMAPEMLGDQSFAITSSCEDGTVCFVECVDKAVEQVCQDSLPPASGGCWVTGGGFVEDSTGKDNFGGNGMSMKNGDIRGEWEHVDHGTENKYHGQVHYLVCRHVDEPGPGQPSGPSKKFNMNQVYYGGPARWFAPDVGWKDGFWFDVFVEDHGEPGNKPGPGQHGSRGPDEYQFTARALVSATQSGAVIYSTGGPIVGGNLQIHPPNNGHPFTAGSLPSWVSFQP